MARNRQTLLYLMLVGLVSVGVVDSQLFELQVPRLGTFLNRITNTTFDLIRGSVNIVVRTVDRIINTFARIEDRVRALLEEFRKQLIKGIPELNIPVLDPLHIDKIQFDVKHEAARIKGSAEDVTISHISKFNVDEASVRDFGSWRFRLDLNFTFPFLIGNGRYQVDGLIGDSFQIFGDGPFWLHLYDLKVQTSTILKFDISGLKVTGLNVELKLGKLENKFENLMHDKENGELINKAISRMAPEALDLIWPELKKPVQAHAIKYINDILKINTVANLVRRLFNIR